MNVIDTKLTPGEFTKLRKRLRKATGEASVDFNMIENGDRIMVCLSGGADSYTLLDMLMYLQKVAPVTFSLVAVNLDQKQPGFPEHILPNYLETLAVEYKILEEDTYSIVKDKIPEGKTSCSLCSRLRRGILYRAAQDLRATKIALGHHREDILETLLLNMFYGGSLKTMPPKLISDDGKNIVIRPLAYCKEAEIKAYASAMNFPIIPCNLCGSQPNLQRQAMKALLNEWDREYPGRLASMMTALSNTSPSHLLDRRRYDFANIQTTDSPVSDGDTLFDTENLVPTQPITQTVIPINPK
ncbi:MAG: tRNA 2-thiocytidine(32) synthetase TtcA [Proteobacteria bacterium]|nr:MAG: tRNA 2-thiocytidine(32) synthetase TtcA [Pseudomonadota bacterium]